MCREPKNPFHPDGCRCSGCSSRGYELGCDETEGKSLSSEDSAWLKRRRDQMEGVVPAEGAATPATQDPADVSNIVDEYQDITTNFGDIMDTPVDDIVARLVKNHDWTPEGAAELVELATKYGWFILRNALALAIALDIEDGTEEL